MKEFKTTSYDVEKTELLFFIFLPLTTIVSLFVIVPKSPKNLKSALDLKNIFERAKFDGCV